MNLIIRNELGKVVESTPAERARAIIDSPHTRQILEQLSPQETYMIIKETWGTDSQILMQYMTPEAICHCIDMDCWDNDSLSIEALLDWLWEIYNSSLDSLQDALQTIDLDIIILLYQSYIDVVQVVPTDENIAQLLDAGYESFDDIYFFIFQEEDEKVQLLKDMLSLIFTHYQSVYYSIMEGVIWELKSSTEESVYERRSLRLMEMGFPPPDEAMSIYQRIQPEKLLSAGISKEKTPVMDKDRGFLPAMYLDHLSRNRGLIISGLGESSSETRERFAIEMVYLANKVVMADYLPLNDIDELKRGIDKASSIASLGLAAAMKANGRSAREVLETTNAETLFSLGYNMVQEQKSRLKGILRRVEPSMIPEGLNDFVEGLMKKRPLFKKEEFSSLDQLEEVTGKIDRIEALVSILDRIGWDRKDIDLRGTNLGSALDLEAVILTSLAINSLERETAFRP
ncbi:MAG TPA: DUF6178 family protein, partial [Deltaproteobacteria bacterium]|nr:DUF6178 family protein [Deltaproteobacteria bacterium]